jgi:hypothetical protein
MIKECIYGLNVYNSGLKRLNLPMKVSSVCSAATMLSKIKTLRSRRAARMLECSG